MSAPRLLSFVLTCVLLAGCPPRALELPPTTGTLAQGLPQQMRSVRRFEDIDVVRDVLGSAGYVYVATDHGVLVYPSEGTPEPTRLTIAEGLPSDDVLALAELSPGRVLAATDEGSVTLAGLDVGDDEPGPPVGALAALLGQDDGTLWACGSAGVLRRASGGEYQRFGEDAECTTLAQAPEGDLWIGTSRGVWHVDGDVVREFTETHGLPLPYARSLVPLGSGRVLALLEGPGESRVAYYDGERWYGYAVPGLERSAVSLVRRGTELFLVTAARLLPLSVGGDGVSLTPLSRSDRFSGLAYRARVRPVSEAPATAPEPRSPRPLAAIPPHQPDVAAPRLTVRPADALGGGFYLARGGATSLKVADANRGVLQVSSSATRRLSSRNLVGESDLSIASDSLSRTWVMTRDHRLAVMRSGRFVPVEGPPGQRLLALSNGPEGAYVLSEAPRVAAPVDPEAGGAEAPDPEQGPQAAEPQAGTRLIVSRVLQDGFANRVELYLPAGDPVFSVPVFGVAEGETAWICPKLGIEGQTHSAGCYVVSRSMDAVHHHRGAVRDGADGPGALSMPDDVSTLDLNQRGMAWLSSVQGAVRVGDSQAVVFGEARGVRGEVVSDVAAGAGARVWIAAAEGLGYFEDHRFEFRLPAAVQAVRVARLAVGPNGHVYGAGHGGLVVYDGANYNVFTEAQGLPFTALRDVQLDAVGHVWLLGEDGVAMLAQGEASAAR